MVILKNIFCNINVEINFNFPKLSKESNMAVKKEWKVFIFPILIADGITWNV